jgi:ERCC4-type nuclease
MGVPKLPVVMSDQEKRPWLFDPELVVVHKRYLRTGDYTLLGLEDQITLERKSLGDFVNTVIHDAIRFRKELVRMSGFDVAAIAVEADVGMVLRHEYESDVEPASVLGKAHGLFLDHGVPVFFWGGPETAAVMAYRLLLLADKKLQHRRQP